MYRSSSLGSSTIHGYIYDGSTYTALDFPEGSGGVSSGTYPRDIDGGNIVGRYHDSRNRGFIATIPEPTTLSLVAMGTLILLRRRR